MSQLYVIDSSAWLEYFADTDRADLLEEVLRECGENQALQIASLIYATTLRRNAELWTQDEHFKDLPNVRYFPKSPPITDHPALLIFFP